MKKHTTKFLTLLLMSIMTIGMFSLETFAAPTEDAVERDLTKKETKEIKDDIWKKIFQSRGEEKVDLSEYDLTEKQATALTNEVLEEKSADSAISATYNTDDEGKVTSMNVEMSDVTAGVAKEIAAAPYEGEGEPGEGEEVTMEEVFQHYMELQKFYTDNPDYFGLATPYFTSKNTENPLAGLLSLLEQKVLTEEEAAQQPQPTVEELDMIVQGYSQTLQLCVAYLGSDLVAAKNQALKQIDAKMSKEEKLLVINDWLGNYCNFDMADIMQQNEQASNENQAEEALATAADIRAGEQQPSDEQMREMLLNGELSPFVKSTAFGALVRKDCLCIGYSAAYTYLVQYAFPEIYKDANGKWKDANLVNNGKAEVPAVPNDPETEEDESKPAEPAIAPTYMVDFVKIFWNSNVSMVGEDKNFRNSHYFNAVNLGDQTKWYYIDPCYNDIYTECMGRNRVETDGNMVHNYFLVSHTTLAQQFQGNYDKIETLYESKATDKTYEEAWFSRARGPVQYDDNNWYYVRNNSKFSNNTFTQEPDELVVRPRSSELLDGSDATVLVNYEDGTGKVTSGAELVTEGTKVDLEVNSKVYSSLMHNVALYKNALYINVDNKILKYDLSTDAITLFKEYNKVSATQDTKKKFAGMSFTVVPEGTKDIAHTVENHPLAAICIKDDGKLYASVATNYAYVSDYTVEETNFNANYMNFKMGNNQPTKKGGDNDNDEFLWSANFVETLDMSHAAGSSHSYETVTVDATCEEAGFTEERCKTCGVVKADSRIVSEEDLATGHHYVEYKDTTYTKKDGENVKVDAVVCSNCMDAWEYEEDSNTLIRPEGVPTGHVYEGKATWNNDYSKATLNVTCHSCEKEEGTGTAKELDFLKDDETIVLAKDQQATVTSHFAEGSSCTAGGTLVYTAAATVEDQEYTDTAEEDVKAGGKHTYETAEFEWSDDYKTCKATYPCVKCDAEDAPQTVDATVTSKTTDPTCTVAGKIVYTANASLNGVKATDTAEVVLNPLGHKYGEPKFTWSSDSEKCTATFTCTACTEEPEEGAVQTVECNVTNNIEEVHFVCDKGGEITYTAVCTFEGKEYTATNKVKVDPTDHNYEGVKPVFTWSADNSMCTATYECAKCGEVTAPKQCIVNKKVTDATYTQNGYIEYEAICDQYKDGPKRVTIPQKDSKARFAKSSYSVYATETIRLSLASEYKEDKIVRMTSSDTRKLKAANDGRVRGERVTGKSTRVTVTATTASGKTIRTTVTIKPTKITLTAKSAPLQVKKSTTDIKVKAKSYAKDSVYRWTSSNTKVATVSKSGKITAKKTGSTTITVTMKSGAKASCRVKVQKSPVRLSKLAVSRSKVTLYLKGGSKTYQIATAKTPVTVSSKVTYSSSKKSVATVSKSGKITAKKAGTATITVRCSNKTTKVKVTVKKKR